MPAQSQANLLELNAIPPELESLCDLESRLISQRIPFMKILNLPRGGQAGIRGAVVNVPTDLTKVTTLLPRTTSNSGLFPLKLKRKLQYRGYVSYQMICPYAVERGLKFLLENNELYKDVLIDQNWATKSAQIDEDLYGTTLHYLVWKHKRIQLT